MPAKHKTLSVYPDPEARAIVGGNSPACNRAIECWAEILRRNQPSDLSRDDWNLMADVLNGTIFDARWTGQFLLAELSDAMDLNGSDWKWYGSEGEELARSLKAIKKQPAKRHPKGDKLLEKVAALDYVGVQSILAAVAWFWDNHEAIDTTADDWWTLPFRVKHEKD